MIKNASYMGGYRILVTFSDGTERLIDLHDFISRSGLPNVRKYLDTDLFRGFYVCEWGLCWGDNEFDINPVDIYNGVFDA